MRTELVLGIIFIVIGLAVILWPINQEVETMEEVNISNDTFVEYKQNISYEMTYNNITSVTFKFEEIDAGETIYMTLDPVGGIKRVPKK